MAKATRTTIPPVPVEPKVIITLELSIEEAETLKGVADRDRRAPGGKTQSHGRYLLGFV